jgi:hypothetical protein
VPADDAEHSRKSIVLIVHRDLRHGPGSPETNDASNELSRLGEVARAMPLLADARLYQPGYPSVRKVRKGAYPTNV